MERERVRALLAAVAEGATSVDDALSTLVELPFEDLGYAKIDHHRALRTGYPEVVFCPGKTPDQVAGALRSIVDRGSLALATRADEQVWQTVKDALPAAERDATARLIWVGARPAAAAGTPHVAVVSAGTADLPVAEEAALTAELLGSAVRRVYDVGVAGLHRLLENRRTLLEARVVVVVAGMEGALASVIGGLVSAPIVAVPTGVGYGASFGGLAALLSMLNSCATGVAVVNIDNGFGAGFFAHLIDR